MEAIGVGLLGLGTVGSAVWELVQRHAANIEEKVGRPVVIRRILVRDPDKRRSVDVPRELLDTDPQRIIHAPDVDVVVELLGAVHPASSYILEAIEAGKSVVTANKDVMAEYGRSIYELAERTGVGIFFEASVGGGIPIVQALKENLIANRFHSIVGILNGTTNYILTRMSESGLEFGQALAEAQDLGYAEADPSADVDGLDAARKIAILGSIAYSAQIDLSDVHVEGIRSISARDIEHGRQFGWTLKLLAYAHEVNNSISLRVHPVFLPENHPLAHVRDSFNAVFVQGDPVGDLMFSGRGAGGGPTASAVVGDVMAAARARVLGHTRPVGVQQGHAERAILPIEELAFPYYLRLRLTNQPGTLAKVAEVFGRYSVNIRLVSQEGKGDAAAEVVFVTYPVSEGLLRSAANELGRLSDIVAGVESIIRIEGEPAL